MRRRRWAGAVTSALAVAVLPACDDGAPAVPEDAASVGLVVTGDGAVGADTPLACALRVVPAEGSAPVGAVSGCTDLVDAQPDLALRLAPGRYVLQAVRVACPGMPGECPEDPYAELFAGPRGGAVLWSCEVAVELAAHQQARVAVDVDPQDGDDHDDHDGEARCTASTLLPAVQGQRQAAA